MWITKNRAQLGPVFGSADMFEGLGLFIDTYKNNRPGVVFPFVQAMYGDGETRYDKDNDGKGSELAGCSARGIRHASVPTKLRLTYFQDKSLKLELQYKNEDDWTLCFENESPPTLPQVAYLGFTSETGELSDNHDIVSIKSKNLYLGNPSTSRGKDNKGGNRKKTPYNKKKKGSWTWFFIKGFLVIAVLGGAYAGYTAYRTSKRSHRF